MSEMNSQPDSILDRATQELRVARVPAGPPAELVAGTVAAIQNRLTGCVPSEMARQQRRRRIMRYVGYGSAAMVFAGLLVTTGLLWSGGQSAEAAFLRAMDRAAKAKTVRFTWTQTNGPPGQKGQIVTTDKNGEIRVHESSSVTSMTVIAKGSKVRLESNGKAIRLEDYEADKGVILDHKYKIATRFTPGGKECDWFGLFNRLASLKPENVKPIGEEAIGTVKALKYELEKLEKSGVIVGDVWKNAKWTVWIDPKTSLPVRLRYMKDENLKWEFEDFAWDEPADDALFDLTPPKGYTAKQWGETNK